MLKSYPAIFHKEEDGSYWVEFPEFGGGTQGANVEEALKNAREMLESVLATYIDEGLDMPWLVRLADREKVNYSEVLTQALETKLQA